MRKVTEVVETETELSSVLMGLIALRFEVELWGKMEFGPVDLWLQIHTSSGGGLPNGA